MRECGFDELIVSLAAAFLLLACGAFVGVAAYRNYLDITGAGIEAKEEGR